MFTAGGTAWHAIFAILCTCDSVPLGIRYLHVSAIDQLYISATNLRSDFRYSIFVRLGINKMSVNREAAARSMMRHVHICVYILQTGEPRGLRGM